MMNTVGTGIFEKIRALRNSLIGEFYKNREEDRKRTIFVFFILGSIPVLFTFSIHLFNQGHFTQGLFPLLIAVIQAIGLIPLRNLKNPLLLYRINVILLGGYFLFLMVIVGRENVSRILWMFIFPPASLFILGKKEGLLLSSITFFLSLFFFIDPHSTFGTCSYETEIKTRFLVAYGLVILISFLVESTLQRYQERVESQHFELKLEISERLQTEEELRKYRDHLEELVQERTSELRVVNEILTKEVEERKRAEAKLNETNVRLQILQQITASVHSTLDFEKVFKQITDGFVFSMGFTSSFIMKLNDQKTHFEVKALSTKQWILDKVDKILGFSIRDYSFPVDPELNATVRAVMKGEVVVAKTAAEIAYPLISKETCSIVQKLGGIKNYIVVPLQVDQEVVGGVIITSTQEEVSEEELKMVKTFSQAASHAIQNANLHKQTQQAEKTLRESEDRYRDLVEHSHDLICTHDLEGRILSANQGALEILGYDQSVILNKNIRDILVPQVQDEFDSYLAAIQREGAASGLMMIQTNREGKRVWEYNNTLRTEGVPTPIVRGMAHDITERLRAEKALRKSEGKYRLVAENIKDVIWTIDLNLRFTYISPSIAGALGYTPEEYSEKKLDELLTPSSLETTMKVFTEEMEVEKRKEKDLFRSRTLEIQLIHKDRSLRWFEIKASFIRDSGGRPSGILGISRDITERKRTEEQLAKLNECLVSFGSDPIKNINRLVALCGEQLRATCALYNRLENGLLHSVGQWNTPPDFAPVDKPDGHICYDLIQSANSEVCVIRNLQQTTYAQTDPNVSCYNLKTYVGQTVSFGGSAVGSLCVVYQEDYIFSEDDRKFIGIIASAIGVEEERKRAEEALQKSEETAKRLAQENAAIAEIGRIINSTLNIEEVYKLFTEKVRELIPFDKINISLINWKEGAITLPFIKGITVSGRQPGDVIPLAGTNVEKVAQTRKGNIFQMEYENEIVAKVPGLLPEFRSGIRSALTVPLISGDCVIGGLGLQSIYPGAYTDRDLRLAESIGNQIAGAIANAHLFAEHTRAEKEMLTLQGQLRQSQKMEAVGRLAGGIAHDFNNLLTVMQGHCDLSLLKLQEGDPLRRNIQGIEKVVEKAAGLTHQLLAFSRHQVMELKVVDLNSLLRNLEKMLGRIIGEDIELGMVLSEELGRVRVDPGQMEQVIMNLSVNARDAMPLGGKLTIETADVELDEEYVRSHVPLRAGSYVMFSMSDTGVGMTKEVREHIFEPFFTTKERGKGTGLGLSTVYGIVQQSGGEIWVYSEPGEGSVFKVYLPWVEEVVEGEGERVERGIPRGNETVLVVEDDEEVRKLTGEILRVQGYRVMEASDGEEGVLICGGHRGKIDLMVTDVVMPRMGGLELVKRVGSICPGMKVLYMSGYTDREKMEGEMNYIQKPFTIEKLARRVREVLDK